MTLWLTFAALAVGFAVLLFAVSLYLQAYLYEQPADRLPLRALAGGILIAGFLTVWVYANTRADSKDKYGTFFEFSATASRQFDEFTAVRRYTAKDAEGKPLENTARYIKRNNAYVEERDHSKPFKLTTADYLVTAIEVPEGDAKIRFEAELFVPKENAPGELRAWKPGDTANPTYSREITRTFREAKGRRYIEFSPLGTPGSIQIPSRGAWMGALLFNALHFLVWFAVFWPVLRFSSGTALGLATAMTLLVMLFGMPFLFERNTAPPPPASAFEPPSAPAPVPPPTEAKS